MTQAAAPILFDRTLLRARQQRAWALGQEAFLLDRVTDEMAERLHAVLREFPTGADIATPGAIARSLGRPGRRAQRGRVG